MKKFMALLVSLTLALSMCVFTAVNASAAEEATKVFPSVMYVDDDFEGYSIGTASALSSTAIGTTAAVNAQIVADADKDGQVYAPDAAGRYTVLFAGSQRAKAKVVTEFDIKATAEVKSGATSYMLALEGATGSQEGRVWWVVPDGTKLRAPGIASLTDENESFADQWYSMKVVYDIQTGQTDWYSAKLGQELTYKGSYTKLLADADKTNIGRINVQGASGFYLDNLKVYEAVDDSEARHLIAKAKAELEAAQIISPAPVIYPEYAISDIMNAIESAEDSLDFAQSAEDVALVTSDFNNSYQEFINSAIEKAGQKEIYNTDFSQVVENGGIYEIYNSVEKTQIGDRDAICLTGNSAEGKYARFMTNIRDGVYYNKYVMKSSFYQAEKGSVHQVLALFSNGANEANTIAEIYSDGTDLILRYSDNKTGYASCATAKSAVLVENYDAETWYDFVVTYDFTDRTFMVSVNNELQLTDRILYFMGSEAKPEGTLMRAGVYALPTGNEQLYVSEFSLVADESASIVDIYKTIGEAIPVGTGRELWRELPETVGNYAITYESEDFQVKYDHTMNKLLAFSTFGTEESEGVLVAKTTVDGTEYSFSYTLPIAAAYTGTVLDHNFDVEAGTKADIIDSNYWTASGEIASVTTLEGVEGGVLSFNGQRTLYSIPEEKRAAGISVLSLKFMAPEAGMTDSDGHIISISGKDGKGAIEIGLHDGFIYVTPGDYIDFDQFPGGYATMRAPLVTNYEAGKWYDIKVLMNFDTRTYKITVDGKTTLNNRVITIADPIRDVGRISIKASQDKLFYIDDLKIYTTDFDTIEGVGDFTIKQNERGNASQVIYPSSFDSTGEMIADDYTFTIEGENTEGISVLKMGAVVVDSTAQAGEYTITATSVYDPSKSVSSKLTVVGVDYAVTEFSITSGGEAIEEVTPGMTVNAKAVVTRNRDAVKSNKVQIILVQYDKDKNIVQVKKGEKDFTQNGVSQDVTAEFTVIGEDTTGHTLRAFLMYGNMLYPITGSIYAF